MWCLPWQAWVVTAKEASNNKMGIIAPGFESDLTDPTKQNRRRSNSYTEDFVHKERAKMARRRDARCSCYYCYPPKHDAFLFLHTQ